MFFDEIFGGGFRGAFGAWVHFLVGLVYDFDFFFFCDWRVVAAGV
jgi:hypothetical protein